MPPDSSDDPPAVRSSGPAPAAPGWYADPGGGGQRYWDGSRWTGDVAAQPLAASPLPGALGSAGGPVPAAGSGRRIPAFLLIPLQIVVLAGGLLLVTRLAGSYIRALVLGAAWMVVAALLFGKIAKQWAPGLRVAVRVVSLVVGLGIAGWVVYSTLHTTTVNETVVRGVAPGAPPRGGGAPPVNVASGRFSELAEGSVRGTATVVRLPDGSERLTLTDFEVSAGPDLRVYLTTSSDSGRGSVGAHRDLGGLKGERGNQQYVVPKGTDLKRYSVVLVYCRSFSVGFARAVLGPG